jgi:Protein of unknown function (DUF2793)
MPDPIVFAPATTRWGLPLLFAAQAQKEVFHNEALARIDGLLHAAVLGEAEQPPASGQDGDCWLVGPVPVGAWSGYQGCLAMRQSGHWLFAQPEEGLRIFDRGARQYLVFSGTWQKPTLVEEPSGGMNVDSEARAAIGALISALRAAGVFPSV